MMTTTTLCIDGTLAHRWDIDSPHDGKRLLDGECTRCHEVRLAYFLAYGSEFMGDDPMRADRDLAMIRDMR